MNNQDPFWQGLHRLRKLVEEERISCQASNRRLAAIEQMVTFIISDVYGDGTKTAAFGVDAEAEDRQTGSQKADVAAVANGTFLSADQARNLKEEDFDVILNVPQQSLRARENPKAKSWLRDCDIKGLRRRKLTLLDYFLEHPKVAVGLHNICDIYRVDEEVPRNTLAKTVLSLRRLLHQKTTKGPFILSTTVWDKSRGREEFIGNGYVMNDKFHYLVILEKF